MKEVILTCVECPLGCEIAVRMENGAVIDVKGNSCPRGKIYAESEVICPLRVLTTTVKTRDGRMLPVKSDKPIEKSKIFEAMKILSGVTVSVPISIGDVVVKNIFKGIDVIACQNVKGL